MAISNSIFNLHWYLTHNPDVAEAVSKGLMDAFDHFQVHGKAEGRSSSPLFNSSEYLDKNADVALAVQNGTTTAYDHFVQFGASEGRSPLKMFDIKYYLAQNPDVAEAVRAGTTSAVEHFLVHGQGEARAFNPSINLVDYLVANPDVATAVEAGFISGMEHLMVHGVAEGRDMGNGVNLSAFENDATFQDALTSGDIQGALVRVGEVAPFLEDFISPAGWEAPADTPIPVDFVPPAGTTLIVPSSVTIPEGTKLPDSFTPPDTYANAFTDLTAQANGFMYAGQTNPADGFVVSTNASVGLELGLDVRYKGDSVNIAHVEGQSQNFFVDATRGADLRFAYSVATTNGEPLDLDAYAYTLLIDTDGGEGQEWVEFTLANDTATSPGSSPYQWTRTEGGAIVDDGGNEAVSQNIQAFHWWGAPGSTETLPVYGDKYDLKLQAHDKETGIKVADSNLTVEVGVVPDVDSYGDLVVGKQDGFMFAGTTNPANGFAISNTHELELGLDVRASGVAEENAFVREENGAYVFNVEAGSLARFAYSAGSKKGDIDLSKYDIKLKIDTDGSGATNFLTFNLAKQEEGASTSGYEWAGEGAAAGRIIADDEGSSLVTQNIQAVGWYLGEDTGNTPLKDGETYNVELTAYLSGSDTVVAHTEIIMVVGAVDVG